MASSRDKLSPDATERIRRDLRFALEQLLEASRVLAGVEAYHRRAKEAVTRAGAAFAAELGEDELRRVMDEARKSAIVARGIGDA